MRDIPQSTKVKDLLDTLSKAGIKEVSFASKSPVSASTKLLDLSKLKSPPEGRYAISLLIAGQEVKTEFVIKANVATCVKSDKAPAPRVIKGSSGRFRAYGNGVFGIILRGDGFTASQQWVFQPDGSALVKEVPDRGEKQRAVPMKKGTR